MRIAFEYDILNRCYKVAAWSEKGGKTICHRITIESVELPDESTRMPYTRVRKEEAQAIFPALQAALEEAGLMKRHTTASDGELTATKAHLSDMQKLIFEKRNLRT